MNDIAFIFTALSIIGTVANSFQKRWCFYVWSITNVFWCIYNALNGMWAQSLLYVFNFSTCIIGLCKWKASKNTCCRGCCRNFPVIDVPDAKDEMTAKSHANSTEKSVKLSDCFMSPLMWQFAAAPSKLRYLAQNAKKHRIRKKNRARLEREYRKYINRTFQSRRSKGGVI